MNPVSFMTKQFCTGYYSRQTTHTCRNQYTVQQHCFKGTVYVPVHVYKLMKFQIKTCTKVNVHITVHLQQCKNFSVALYNFIEHVHVHNSRDYQYRVNRLSNSQRVCMVLEHFTGRVNYSTLIYNLPTDSIYFVIKGVFSTHHCHIAYLVHVSGDAYNCLYCKQNVELHFVTTRYVIVCTKCACNNHRPFMNRILDFCHDKIQCKQYLFQ